MIIKKLIKFLISILLICLFIIVGTNIYVIFESNKRMIDIDSIDTLQNKDVILVLGCGLETNETPSEMLAKRLDKAIELYHLGISETILMSGDNGDEYHDEVTVMKNYALEHDVPLEHILMDPYGFSTYESMVRAKEVFNTENIVIVTQQYHLYRAVYIANKLGMNAYGISSSTSEFNIIETLEIREVLARTKDFVFSIIKPNPTYLNK